MLLGIDPKVDYAFKRLFGTIGHEPLLIDLLNAVLHESIPDPIDQVELLNPFDEKQTEDDKLSILDIKARDRSGRWFNVEMQVRSDAGYAARALYYWSGLFRDQLHEGEGYDTLRPAIAIHFIDWLLFRDAGNYHLDFQLRSRNEPQLVFSPLLQLHLIQLPLCTDALDDPLQRWCYLLREGEGLDPQSLPSKLNTEPIRKAMEVLAMMVQTPQERAIYEGRRKQHLDYISGMSSARREGWEEGKEEGRQEGEIIGLHKAIEKLLLVRFSQQPVELLGRVRGIVEFATLDTMLQQVAQAASLDEIRQLWNVPITA